jgi:hypothetical protein
MPPDCIAGTISAPFYQAGHEAKMARGSEVNYYGYTASGRLRLEGRMRTDGSGSMDVTRYGYDGNGNVVDVQYPAPDPNSGSMAREIQYVHGQISMGDDPDAIRQANVLGNMRTQRRR